MAGRHQGPAGKGAIRRLFPQRDSAASSAGVHWRTTRITEVFLVVTAGEGAWPIERRAAVARLHLGAVVWVLSALHFREIMTLVPFDAAAVQNLAPAPAPGCDHESTAPPATRRYPSVCMKKLPARGMTSPHLLLWLLLAVAANALAAEWKPAGEPDRQDSTSDLFYAKRTAVRPSDGRQVTAHLAFFTSRAFRLEVVDLGAGPEPTYPTLGDAFRAQGCVAGVNGGFFHPDWRPSGLVISRGSGSTGSRPRNSSAAWSTAMARAPTWSGGPSSRTTRASPPCCRPAPTSWKGDGRCGAFPRPTPSPDLHRHGWARALGARRHPEHAHPRRARAKPRRAGCPDQLEGRSGHQPRRRLLDRILLRPEGRRGPGGAASLEAGPQPAWNQAALNPAGR